MTVLVEVHDEAETERAVALGAELLGVNARNLKTLEIDQDVFGRLAPLIPDDRVKVAESGIFGPVDVKRLRRRGRPARCWWARPWSRTATPRARSAR